MKPLVRKATLEDVPRLLEFEQGLIKVERPMDPSIRDGNISYYDIREFIDEEAAVLYVAELEGEIVSSGYARIMTDRPYLKHTHFGYLGFMFVPKEHRGNGYNQLVLDALIDWCKKRNIYEIRLDVYAVNEAALKAYTKAGFQPFLVNMRLDH